MELSTSEQASSYSSAFKPWMKWFLASSGGCMVPGIFLYNDEEKYF
jgi:hypothetical protein